MSKTQRISLMEGLFCSTPFIRKVSGVSPQFVAPHRMAGLFASMDQISASIDEEGGLFHWASTTTGQT